MAKSYRKYLAGAAAVAVVASSAPAAGFAAEASKNFTDVSGHWGLDHINYLLGKGSIDGYGDKTFRPDNQITRAEAATLLARTLDLDIQDEARTNFRDAANHWGSEYIAAIQHQLPTVINGYDDKTFRPDEPITRQEMAKMIATAYDLKLNTDADISFDDNKDWGTEYINILASLGVADGYGKVFRPEASVTRAETAAFVHRAEVKDVRKAVPSKTPKGAAVQAVSSIDHKQVRVEFDKAISSINADDFTISNGIKVLGATIEPNNNKVVYLTTTAQTSGFEYQVNYKESNVGKFTFEGNTGAYNTNIKVTPLETELKQVSTPEAKHDANVDRGKRTYEVTITDLTGHVDIALVPADEVGKNADGVPVFGRDNDSLRLDFDHERKLTSASIEEINGVKQDAGTRYVNNVQIPANGKITFTVDNEGAAEVLVPVVYQDANNDNHLSVDENKVATEAVAVGGQVGYYTSKAKFGTTKDVTPIGFAFNGLNAFIDAPTGVLYNYDENDTFQVDGVDISIDDFETLLTTGDKLDVIYAPDGSSTFNFTTEVGSEAPTSVDRVVVGGDNVRVSWSGGNIRNAGTVYKVERASVVGPDGVAGTPDDITSDYQWVEVGTTKLTSLTDVDVADGRYVYRVTVQNPVTKVVKASPVTTPVDVPVDVAAAAAPTIKQATAVDKGTTGEVDAGDVWNILFSKQMDLQNGDWIRVSEGRTGEYSEIVLGEGNTFKTTTYPNGETLLTITFTEVPAIDGYNTFNREERRNGVLEYPLWITNSNGFDSKDGARLANTPVQFADRDDLYNDLAPVVTDSNVVDANSFVVKFDEAIDLVSGNDKKNYTVTKGNGDVNEVTRVKVLNPREVQVWTIDALGFDAELAQTVSDVDGNKAAQKDIVLTESAPTVHPKVVATDLNVEKDYIEVTFDIPVTFTGQNPDLDDKFTFEHAADSTNKQGNVASFKSTNVDPVEGKPNTVRVHFENAALTDGNFVEGNFGTLIYGDIAAIKGAAQGQQSLEAGSFVVADVDPNGTGVNPNVKLTGAKEVVVTFDEFVKGQADEDDFKVQAGTVAIDVDEVVIDKNTVTLTLAEEVTVAGAFTLTYTEGNITDEQGNKVDGFSKAIN